MTERLGFKSWATGALVLAAVTACGHSGTDPVADPPSPTASSSPTPVVTSSAPASPTEIAAAQATQKVKDYLILLDQLGQDPKKPIGLLSNVTTSVLLTAERHYVASERAKGNLQIGDLRIVDMKVQSVNLDNSNPGAGHVPTVVVDVCWDVRRVDVVDPMGKSAVLPTRPDGGVTRYYVANYHWAKHPAAGWRVADARDQELKPCLAA